MAILEINGRRLPEPSAYQLEAEPFGHFERNANGYLVGDLIGVKTKLLCTWALLEDSFFRQILTAALPYFVDVTYFDPQAGGLVTKEMFVSPQGGSLAVCMDNEKWWADVSVSFTER